MRDDDPWPEGYDDMDLEPSVEHTARMDQAALDDDRDLDYLRGRYPNAGRACDHDYPTTTVLLGDEEVPGCDGCGVARVYLPPRP